MNTLEFIAAILDSVAWPLAITVIVVVFRQSVSRVVEDLSDLKLGSLELGFRRKLRELERAADSAGMVPQATPPTSGSGLDRDLEEEVEAVAHISPLAAIPLAWVAIEMELTATAMRLAVSPDYPPDNSAIQNIRFLRQARHLSDDIVAVLGKMREIRNEVSHGQVSPKALAVDEAVQYGRVAKSVIQHLRSLDRLRPPDLLHSVEKPR